VVKLPTFRFSVDSALLREIGERLVGKPFIALAELVKNGYDADARKVIITVNPAEDRITVRDNGHGMTKDEFKDFWMRVGSTHKVKQRVSRNFHRPMTGSKGIGRLAVQYLAEEMVLFTTSENDPNRKLRARVRWEEAIRTGDLINAKVHYRIAESAQGFRKGTYIILKGLKQRWDERQIAGLANEVWWLKPPFETLDVNPKQTFSIKFKSVSTKLQDAFNQRIGVALDLWNARIKGKNQDGHVSLSLEFKGKETLKYAYEVEDCHLVDGKWEIRVYLWQGRQLHKIKVGEARRYFTTWGGVHLYDKGFRLPFYGDTRNDWLQIELDHSHRLTSSKLLPDYMQTALGLQMLPTLSRIFGVVNVDTSREPNLEIALTRDRLQESKALDDLREMVRFGLDWYAVEEKKRKVTEDIQKAGVSLKAQSIDDVLVEYEPKMQQKVYRQLKTKLEEVTKKYESDSEKIAKQIGLVGSLATAGITSVAYQHELRRQFRIVEEVIDDLGKIETSDEKIRPFLAETKGKLATWLESAKATNSLFGYFSDTANIQLKKRFSAKKTIDEIKEQLTALARGIPIDTKDVDANLLLPKASLVEWSAIFQNVFVNSFNALVDSKQKLIRVVSRSDDQNREILVEDTGSGVDLKSSDELFKPFVRRIAISSERKALGYGGMGLGLTIVKLVANNVGCDVSFVKPDPGHSTAFSLRWRESE
jgi:signal transduction histidine kinase